MMGNLILYCGSCKKNVECYEDGRCRTCGSSATSAPKEKPAPLSVSERQELEELRRLRDKLLSLVGGFTRNAPAVKGVTTVYVGGQRWDIPCGFKRLYLETMDDPADPAVLSDILWLIGYEASAATIAAWPLQKRVEAEVYAGNVHLRASDNPVRRHPTPAWLPEPWKGGEDDVSHMRSDLQGAFAGPRGTPLT